ncbi:AAA family ATPase [Streptomyces sp. NPDC055037]
MNRRKCHAAQPRNFRNFEDLTIDPFPSPAVIVGENAVGKSNLLAALLPVQFEERGQIASRFVGHVADRKDQH